MLPWILHNLEVITANLAQYFLGPLGHEEALQQHTRIDIHYIQLNCSKEPSVFLKNLLRLKSASVSNCFNYINGTLLFVSSCFLPQLDGESCLILVWLSSLFTPFPKVWANPSLQDLSSSFLSRTDRRVSSLPSRDCLIQPEHCDSVTPLRNTSCQWDKGSGWRGRAP